MLRRWAACDGSGESCVSVAQSSFRTIAHMDLALVRQLISFVGALLILVAYVGHQLNWMDSRHAAYNVMNAIGSAILAYIAFHPFQVGFVVLEVTWALVSVYALISPRPNS
jgi:hypothetical protein